MKFLPTWIGVKNTIGQTFLFCFVGFVVWDIPQSFGWAAVGKGGFLLLVLVAIFALEFEKWVPRS